MAPRKTAAVIPKHPADVPKTGPQPALIGHNSGMRPIAIGRDGKPIYLTDSYDPTDFFAVASQVQPDGWTYEWKRYSIYNEEQKGYQAQLKMNGHWTPVQHESHPGVFGSTEATGAIIYEGQILMERPAEVHAHFKSLEKARADQKIASTKASHGLGGRVAPGVDPNTQAARQNSFVRSQRVAVEDIPKPGYSYDPTTID